jgi:hypothetical protein
MSTCGMTLATVDGDVECVLDASHLDADNPSTMHQAESGEAWSAFFDKR